jgi:hypothetical protein
MVATLTLAGLKCGRLALTVPAGSRLERRIRRWLRAADDLQEAACPAVADVAELPLEVGDGLLEAAVGGKVAGESAAFGFEQSPRR